MPISLQVRSLLLRWVKVLPGLRHTYSRIVLDRPSPLCVARLNWILLTLSTNLEVDFPCSTSGTSKGSLTHSNREVVEQRSLALFCWIVLYSLRHILRPPLLSILSLGSFSHHSSFLLPVFVFLLGTIVTVVVPTGSKHDGIYPCISLTSSFYTGILFVWSLSCPTKR